MKPEEIIHIAQEAKDKFQVATRNVAYEAKGIINSEMLLFLGISEHLKVRRIIESGRARGQSTKITAEYFKDEPTDIFSIEKDKYTKDTLIALDRLKKYKKLHLLYGKSEKIIPSLTIKPCTILIDGPKGDDAINLALQLINNKNIKAIFIHDVHQDSPHREIIENIFTSTYFSDNNAFVESFQGLDKDCWSQMAKYPSSRNRGPYKRDSLTMKSYSSTLGVIFNSQQPIREGAKNEFLNRSKIPEMLFIKVAKFSKQRLKSLIHNCFYFLPVKLKELQYFRDVSN